MNMSPKEKLTALQETTLKLMDKVNTLKDKYDNTIATLTINANKINSALIAGGSQPITTTPEIEEGRRITSK
jgi:hypothetical protein